MKMDKIRKMLGVSGSFFAAMKMRMGLSHVRIGFVSQFADFIRENPTFKQSDVYHRPTCRCAPCRAKRAVPGPRRGRPRRPAAAQSSAAAHTDKSSGLSLT